MAVTALSQAVLAGMDPKTYRSLQDMQTGEALSQQSMDASPTSKWGAYGRLAQALAGSYLSNSASTDLAKTIAEGKKSAADLWLQKAAPAVPSGAPSLSAVPHASSTVQPGVQPDVAQASSSPFPNDTAAQLPASVPNAPPTPGTPAAAVADRSPGDPSWMQSAQAQITPPAQQPTQVADAGPVAAINAAIQPRGIRNANPLNIEDGDFAKSQPGYAGSDGRFAKFQTPEHGVAAANKLLDIYDTKHGANTVASIVNRWAPPSDGNNTMAYAADVAGKLGIDPNAPVPAAMRPQLIAAMAKHENGVAAPGTVGAPVRVAAAAPVVASDADPETTATAKPGEGLGVTELMKVLHHPYSSDAEKELASKLILQKLSPDEYASGPQGIYSKSTGDVKTPATPKQEWQVVGKDKFGQPVYGYPPSPQEYAARPKIAERPDPLDGVQGPQRLDALKQIDPARASQVQAVLEGRTPYPVGSRLNPQQQQLKEDVTQIDPNYTSGTYQARSNFQKSMAGTAPGTFGGQVRSAGTVAKHLGDADAALLTLERGRLGAGDTLPMLNGTKNWIRNQSGDQPYQDATGHYETARKGLSDEVETLLAGGHGAEGSKAYWLDRLDLNKHGPTEVRGALDEFRSLMNGRLSNVAQEKDRVFGDESGHTDPLTLFGPHERDIMQRIQNHTWGAKQDAASPEKAATAPATATPPAPALAKLIANPTPQMKQHFDDVFGAGAADRALGGK